MCGRYYIDEEDLEFREILDGMKKSPLMQKWIQTDRVVDSGEIHPTDIVPVIASNRSGMRSIFPMKWGYNGKSLLINARMETAAEKPTFREDWTRHRCIVPASWYFEWEHVRGTDGKIHTTDKYVIQPKGDGMTWLCGMYRIEEGLPHFVILTREPAEKIRFIHDRMPFILPKEKIDDWIRPQEKPEDLIGEALTEMVFEKAEG